MINFEKRRDIFEVFSSFDSPFVNITFRLETEDFRGYCRDRGLPPFHFFLYHVFSSLMAIDNFRYRYYQGEVIKIERPLPSYTVKNRNDVLNFTRFEYTPDLGSFIERSLKARDEAVNSERTVNSATDLSEREFKDSFLITCIPWLDFTSIQHPVGKFRAVDIPALAWGKISSVPGDKISMPFSVQAHHGFVDGYHIHLLAEDIASRLRKTISR